MLTAGMRKYRLQSMTSLMERLKSRLGVDPESRAMVRAKVLASNDLELLSSLVDLRRQQKISQTDLAEKLGISQATVAAFERTDNDPKLSTIRRYAHGVGALIVHRVALDEGQLMGQGVSGWDAAASRRAKIKPHTPVGNACVRGPAIYTAGVVESSVSSSLDFNYLHCDFVDVELPVTIFVKPGTDMHWVDFRVSARQTQNDFNPIA